MHSFPNHKFCVIGYDNCKEGVEMKKLILLLSVMFCLCCTGCATASAAPDAQLCRVDTEIIIEAENTADPGQCRYVDSHKMSKALTYLRHLDYWDQAKTPPDLASDVRYQIHLRFSDGTTASYEQVGYTHFKKQDGPWLSIASEQGIRLALILAAVPSDPIL